MLEIKNFSKSYNKKTNAVDNISFEVKNGDIFGFIGHNGAGKTTTIKACVGILDFNEGEILIDNTSVKEKPIECKKKLAYLPDNPDLYEFLSGIKYLNFIADVYSVSRKDRDFAVDKYSSAFELKEKLGAPISTYSHGMKQKLVITAALIHNPSLLVCDEPFVGLDPKAAAIFKEIMREMCKKGGSVLFSTHVLEVAEKLCNRIAIIKSGRIVACGDMSEVRGDNTLEEVFLELENNE